MHKSNLGKLIVESPVCSKLGYIIEILLLSIRDPLPRFVVLLSLDTLHADDDRPYLYEDFVDGLDKLFTLSLYLKLPM